MGFLLQARAPLKKKGLFSSRITADQVAAALLAAVKGTPLESVASSERLNQAGFRIGLHPAGDAIYVTEAEDHIEIEAKTSVIGPGYHAFLVSILDSLQSGLKLQWDWNDEADYVQRRDFRLLQSRMAAFLQQMSKASFARWENDEDVAGSRLMMDSDFPVESHGDEVLAPLGPLTVKEFRRWQDLGEAELNGVAADFYPWWGERFDASFYRGLTLHAIWNDVRWAWPIDPKEVELAKRTLTWYKEATNRGAAFPFPPMAPIECVDVIRTEPPLHFPRKDGIGYRRRLMKKRFGGNWTLTLPASLGQRVEEEKTDVTFVFENHILEIRVSGGEADARKDLNPDEVDIERRVYEDRAGLFVLNILARTLTREGTDAICIVTATLKDDRFRDLVEQILDSLEYTGEADPEEDEED